MDVRLALLDLDGTLYRGEAVVPGAPEAVALLRREGIKIRFLTNNSGAQPESTAQKLRQLGITAEAEEVFGTAQAAARYCNRHQLQSAFVVGEPGLVQTLLASGIHIVNQQNQDSARAEADSQAGAVVVGICRTFTYAWLNAALQQLLSGAKFVATNPDVTYPIANGGLEPGAGSIVAAVQACSGLKPVMLGKPQPDLALMAMEHAGESAESSVLIGDRIDTDIACAEAAGCRGILFLGGVTRTAPSGMRCLNSWDSFTLDCLNDD